jgi:hypothetical protein
VALAAGEEAGRPEDVIVGTVKQEKARDPETVQGGDILRKIDSDACIRCYASVLRVSRDGITSLSHR